MQLRPTKTLNFLNSILIGLFAISQPLLGDFFKVDSAVVSSSNELMSFVVGGRTVTQAELIQPTLTAFAGNPWVTEMTEQTNITIPRGEILPTGAARSRLLTHDFQLDTTGGANVAVGNTAAALSFAAPLVNGPGADLVFFESSGADHDRFQLLINSISRTITSANYGPNVTGVIPIAAYFRTAGAPNSLSQLENDPYSLNLVLATIAGVAIDLDDFGVVPFGSVSMIQFGSDNTDSAVDPYLFMGIQVVPEPSSMALLAMVSVWAVGYGRIRRRKSIR